MIRRLFSSTSLLGIDIRPDGIRFVQIRKQLRGYLVEHASICPLPPTVFVEGRIRRWDVLQILLAEYVHEHGMKGMAAAICLPMDAVRMQHVQVLEGLPEAGIEAEIDICLQRDFPGVRDVLCVDYCVSPHKEMGYWDVHFTAARQEYVAQYAACVSAAGLSLKIVDIDVYALRRVVAYTEEAQAVNSMSNAFLQLGSKSASLSIFRSQDVGFHKEWDISAVDGDASQLSHHIQQAMLVHRQSNVTHLSVSGGSKCVQWFADVAAACGLNLRIPDPFVSMKLTAEVDLACAKSSDYLVACGLAMRESPRW